MFIGCGTAMVTPFRKDGSLDEATLRKLVRRQIEKGIDFLVPCGTTGESPTLTREEHLRVVEVTIEESAHKVPVLAGAGGNNTHEVIEMLARACQKLGADGILSRHSVLQQNHAGGPLPALQSHRASRSKFRSFCTKRAGPGTFSASTSSLPRWSAWPGSMASSASRKLRETSARLQRNHTIGSRRNSSCFRVTMR